MSDPSTILHDPSAALDRIEARASGKRWPTVADIGALRADNTDLVAALRAVLDLHKPEDHGRVTFCCSGCEGSPDVLVDWTDDASDVICAEWPCPTVTAITTALSAVTR